MTVTPTNEQKRSSLERRSSPNRRQAEQSPPGGVERRKRDRREALADRRTENNLQLVTFYLDGEFFGIQVGRVQEILLAQQMTPVPNSSDEVVGLINLRGQIVTAIDLRKVLGLAAPEKIENQTNVIIRFQDGSDSLLVDRIGDVLEVAASKIEPPPSSMKGIDRKHVEGVCKLENTLLVLLDVDRVTGRTD
jgi:purine-binding chemotaxis protein CheW